MFARYGENDGRDFVGSVDYRHDNAADTWYGVSGGNGGRRRSAQYFIAAWPTYIAYGGFLLFHVSFTEEKTEAILDDSYVIEIAEGARARVLKGSVSSKREGGEAPRPRKVKKKKRVARKETTGAEAIPAPAADALPKPVTLNEGVSVEENEALINGLDAAAPDDEKNVSAEEKD